MAIPDNSIAQILNRDHAKAGDHYTDDLGNDWLVHEDRDGLRLEFPDDPNVWVPYRTSTHISLPGLRRCHG